MITQENVDRIMENYNLSTTDKFEKNKEGNWETSDYNYDFEIETITVISITNDKHIIIHNSVLEDGYDEGDSYYDIYKTLKDFEEDL